jgi:hypothetical protein
MWLYRTYKVNKFYLCGYKGQTRLRMPIYMALRVPKTQGLPATEAQGRPFIWLSRTHKVNKSHSYGSTGQRSPRTLIFQF